MDEYQGEEGGNPQSTFCYIIFIVATFITQITMLNMLIAIMGDTFERIYTEKAVNALKTKIELMHDMALIMNSKAKNEEEKVFLFVVQPEQDEEEDVGEWVGTFNSIKAHTQKRIQSLQDNITNSLKEMKVQAKTQEQQQK